MDFSKKTKWIVWLSHNFENCPSMIFPSKLLEPAKQLVASPSSSDANMVEGDNFQNYGDWKDQCIYICNVIFTYRDSPHKTVKWETEKTVLCEILSTIPDRE